MNYLLVGLCLLLGMAQANAQQTYTISGSVTDGSSGETIIGGNVIVGDGSTGTVTNAYGFYSISLPEDSVQIRFSYTGMQTQSFAFYLDKDTTINVVLDEGVAISEVTVSATSAQEKVNSVQMGADELTVKEVKELPVLFGEVDILKTLQLKPGVQSGGEGNAGLFVRGGSADQNLFVLDEAPVYNPTHLFGFFSTFNADAIKDVKLYKAAFPSEYGGRLSSVIDIKLREGNRKKFEGSGGLGLISSRLTLEGPLIKDKASFIVSGRRTYFDVFTRAINASNSNNPDFNPIPNYFFYDLNAKVNYDLGEKDKVYLSGYFGRDVFGFGADDFSFGFDWGNTTGTARWNHIFNGKLFANTAFTYSDYQYTIENQFDVFSFAASSGIRDMNLKTDFAWFPNEKHSVKFGANAIYHRFVVGRIEASSEDNSVNFNTGDTLHSGEYALYINDEYKVSKRLSLSGGLRLSGFNTANQFYGGIEPRLAGRYDLTPSEFKKEKPFITNVSLKASYARMYQYIHLVANSAATLPTDIWYPSTEGIGPQSADIVSVGTAMALGRDYFFSFELYYKWLYNQVGFREGADLFGNPNLEEEFAIGEGDAYGMEVYLERKLGRFRGWVGYTLAWAWRQFPFIPANEPEGIRFRPRFDRRHDISVVLTYDLHPRLTLSTSWVYGTGDATSFPEGRMAFSGSTGSNPLNFVPLYTGRGEFRFPAYHRLDLGAVWKLAKPSDNKKFISDLTFSVYNAYNRYNVFFLFIDQVNAQDSGFAGIEVPERFAARAVTLFPIIPTVTWNFKF